MQEHLIGHKYNYKSHKCNNNKHLVTNIIKITNVGTFGHKENYKSHKYNNIR